MYKYILAVLTSILIFGCAYAQDKPEDEKEHSKEDGIIRILPSGPFDIKRNAMADVDAGLARAKARGVKAMVIMGGNWCHDSLGLLKRFETGAMQTLISENYEIIYVSTGEEVAQKDQNAEVAKRFGLDVIEGTPTVFITASDGMLLNEQSAKYWRHADAIPGDMQYSYFNMYAKK